MADFEDLLEKEHNAVERFVRFRISSRDDADDVLQEIFLTAYKNFPALKNKDSFKAWIFRIAGNKCNDYFRKKAERCNISIDEVSDKILCDGRYGISIADTVRETFSLLEKKDRQILYLYYWQDIPQADISRQLNIPLGTVKSRLHTAKQNFKNIYPDYNDVSKGNSNMKKTPDLIPEYKIEENAETPFNVKWNELMGWFLVPQLGEKLSWGMYDIPSRKCIRLFDMEVTGKAKVHGIEGVEFDIKETSCINRNDVVSRTFVAQLTDTHCRYLASLRYDGDVRNYITFLDGNEFLDNWGFGEDNCGKETNMTVKGDIVRNGTVITTADKDFLLDVAGRYTVTINGKSYDTICVMCVETYDSGVASEQFIDRNGRTVLMRNFTRDDWAFKRYKKKWSEMLPDNERLTINGTTYVHWIDGITEYIL